MSIQFILLLPILIPILAAPVGVPLLGYVALNQIRHSAGRLYGLGLALFDLLVFPLLALDAMIAGLGILAVKASMQYWENTAGGTHGELVAAVILLHLLIVVLCAVIDLLIIRWAWRAANRPVVGGDVGGVKRTAGNEPARSPTDSEAIEEARQQVQGPAIGLLVTVILFLLPPVLFIWFLLAGHRDFRVDLDADVQFWLGLVGFPLSAGLGAVLAWETHTILLALGLVPEKSAAANAGGWCWQAIASVVLLAVSLFAGGGAIVVFELLRQERSWNPSPSELVVTTILLGGTALMAATTTLLGIEALRRIHRASQTLRGRAAALAAAWFWPIMLILMGILLAGSPAIQDARPNLPAEPIVDVAKPFGGPWVAGLPGGSIELVAVSRHPSAGLPWWRPDGSPCTEGPFESTTENHFPERRGYDFVIRPHGLEHASLPIWKLVGDGHDSTGGPSLPADAELTTDYLLQCLSFPQSVPRATLSVGVAIGTWRTLSTCDRNGISNTPPNLESGSWFPIPVETADGNVVVNVAYSTTGHEVRLIALDETGKEHKTWGSGVSQLQGYRQVMASFRGLSLKRIKEFRFQARPYHWAEFRNVALQPRPKNDTIGAVDALPPAEKEARPANATPEETSEKPLRQSAFASFDSSAVAKGAMLTWRNYVTSSRAEGKRVEFYGEIPVADWAPEIRDLRPEPIYVYAHGVNIVIVRSCLDGKEQGIYVTLIISSTGGGPHEDQFTRVLVARAAGGNVWTFVRNGSLDDTAAESKGASALKSSRAVLMRTVVLAGLEFATEHPDWPKTIEELPSKYLDDKIDLGRFVYHPPGAESLNKNPQEVVVLLEKEPAFAGGQLVGFADGYVQFVRDPQRLKQLLPAKARPAPPTKQENREPE